MSKEIAKIILDQLNVRKTEVWAWGSNNFYHLEREVDGIKHPALMFSIKTPKIQRGGRVVISLDQGSDTYIVEAFTVRNEKEKSLGNVKDVHCMELHSAINSLIEDNKTYTNISV